MFGLRQLARLTIPKTRRQCFKLANNRFHDEFSTLPKKPESYEKLKTSPAVASKFNVYSDDNASVILDVEEERQRFSENLDQTEAQLDDLYSGINLERGVNGVFEIEDLVEVLRRENAEDIFVCTVSKELKYVDYMCIVTGHSNRHRKAIAEFVRKLFKLKRHRSDVLPKIEGEGSKEWMALDLGNIALHIFSEETRIQYDLESLWTVGPEFDKECNKPDNELMQLLENHTLFMRDLTPNTNK